MPRGIPYLGNLPVVCAGRDRQDRIGTIAGCLLDEIFLTLLWRCRVGQYQAEFPGILFTAGPTELILLAALSHRREATDPIIVYHDPLLGADEDRPFSENCSECAFKS